MKIEYDPAKRKATLRERGVDFEDAGTVFSGTNFTFPDIRYDYGEPRFTMIGFFGARMMVLVWTPRADARRIISMRKANDREQEAFRRYFT
jgi:hypothetical protein